MTIPRTTAKQICTQSEYELVLASFSPEVERLHPTRIGVKRDRARKLADKYRQLLRKQDRALKGDASAKDREVNARTEKKMKLFDETRARFEKRVGVRH